MIYTVTLNPAIDYTIHANDLQLNAINRSSSENIAFGGKGINVSTILKELGVVSTAMGFIAGFTGEAIENGLKEKGIKTDFVRLEKGLTRINIKIRSKGETDLNGQGPDIDGKAVERLFEKLSKLSDNDTLVLAGSIPNGLSDDIYEKILEKLRDRRIRTVVDATKKLLLNTLKYRPFLIKPNDIELGEIFGSFPKNAGEAAEQAKSLQNRGARNVLVSMAEKG
ncbi:MAG: hexose kinase, partial [Ruminiclostridium sp.]|nr:hexose kinase [Ruminiclostridium sp.]